MRKGEDKERNYTRGGVTTRDTLGVEWLESGVLFEQRDLVCGEWARGATFVSCLEQSEHSSRRGRHEKLTP